jgi:Domain of unknown function (DUF4326)
MISVINGKKIGFIGEDKIYVGRSNKSYGLHQSPLANPYVIGRDGNREEVIQKYRRWLWTEMKTGIAGGESAVFDELLDIAEKVKDGENVALTCWCKPESCHGDIVSKAVNWMIKENIDW